MFGDGAENVALPFDITEVTLCERFGWTFTELDSEDMARVVPAVSLANIRAAIHRVNAFLESGGRYTPSDSDLMIYKMAVDADKDSNSHG